MFCSLEKLKIGMSVSLLLGMFLTAHGEVLSGGLDSSHLSLKGKNMTWSVCRDTICGDNPINCHFAHTKSKECYQINLPLQLLLKWFPVKIYLLRNFIIKDENMKIYYFYSAPAVLPTEKPRVWWLLDNVSKGRNFGSAGSALDIPVGSVVWANDSKGPRAGSPLLYAEGKYEQVALKHNGRLLLDMTDKFTISMWIKTDRVPELKGHHMVLLGGVPEGATRFALWPSRQRTTLALGFSRNLNLYFYTNQNTADYNDWRHVAVVSSERNTRPTFYLNGYVWALNKNFDVKNTHRPRVRATHLSMWKTPWGEWPYEGQIACVMVFQATLSQSQIKVLKDNCP